MMTHVGDAKCTVTTEMAGTYCSSIAQVSRGHPRGAQPTSSHGGT